MELSERRGRLRHVREHRVCAVCGREGELVVRGPDGLRTACREHRDTRTLFADSGSVEGEPRR